MVNNVGIMRGHAQPMFDMPIRDGGRGTGEGNTE
jgi:hypothetical protein